MKILKILKIPHIKISILYILIQYMIDMTEQLIIHELSQKPLRFFSVLEMEDALRKKIINIGKEEIKDVLEYFFNKEMLCRIKSQKLNNPYLYLYGMRISYINTNDDWVFMHNISEFTYVKKIDIN